MILTPNMVLVGKTGHDVMRELAPSILADALGEGGHSVFIEPAQISTPMFDPDGVLAAESGVEKLVAFLVAFKLAIRAMGAKGAVTWREDSKGPGGQFTFFPAI